MNFISLEPSPQQPNLNQKKVYCATETVLGAFMIVSFLVYDLQVDNIPVTCIPTNAIIIQSCHIGMLSIYIIYYPRIKLGCDSDSGF